MRSVSFSECRAAARSTRRAEFGREASLAARPRGQFGLFRSRAPISLLLYVAGREDRLVWQSADGFALIEPPTTARARLIGGGARLSLFRMIDRWWEALPFVVPAALLLLAALALAPFRSLWPVVALLALLALGYIAVMMVACLLWQVSWFYRHGRPRRQAGQLASESLPGSYWHVPLCHQLVPGRCDELLQEVSTRLIRLMTSRVHAAAAGYGGRVESVTISEILVCLRNGATTRQMRASIDASTGMLRPYGDLAEVVVMTAPEKAQAVPRGKPDRGTFLFWFLVAMAVLVAILADPVARNEREACAGIACDGRPADYWAAVRWLVDESTFYLGFSDLSPATTYAWFLGWLMRINGVIGLFVIVVASRRFAKHIKGVNDTMTRETAALVRPIVLIMVTKANERDAVFAAVRQINGVQSRAGFGGTYPVWELGRLGGADVRLAQCPQQGGHGPDGMTLFARDVLASCDPDYVFLTGLCYGLREDLQRIGDVIVSRKLEDIDPKRLTAQRDVATGHRVPGSGFMLSRLNAATVDWTGQAVHFGLMLGSSSLFDSAEHRQRLRDLSPEAIGGDMESEAVYAVAQHRGVDWVVVKAIADWGSRMTYEHQALAAGNAAGFVVHAIASGGFAQFSARKAARQ